MKIIGCSYKPGDDKARVTVKDGENHRFYEAPYVEAKIYQNCEFNEVPETWRFIHDRSQKDSLNTSPISPSKIDSSKDSFMIYRRHGELTRQEFEKVINYRFDGSEEYNKAIRKAYEVFQMTSEVFQMAGGIPNDIKEGFQNICGMSSGIPCGVEHLEIIAKLMTVLADRIPKGIDEQPHGLWIMTESNLINEALK